MTRSPSRFLPSRSAALRLACALALALSASLLPAQNAGSASAAPAFSAVDMDGKRLNFPADYRGKIVLLDFWATWCGPCMGEVPGLVAAYAAYHGRGFDILGVSLDPANFESRIRAVEDRYGMKWRQVYDGKYWQAAVAVLYGIESIPSPFLVDGDSGKILAQGDSLRGASLSRVVAQALAKKGK